jgi:hypothetical protein
MIHRIIGSFFGPAWRSDMKKLLITTAVGLCLAAPAFAQTAADQKGLVTVNLQDVLNNLSADLKVDRANIPVTAQIPINAAANVCGVSVNVLSQQAAGGSPSCNAKTGSQDLTQAVQQQMAAGGNTGNQSGTTAAVNQAAPSSASAPATSAAAPANSAAAPAAAGTAQTQPNAQQLNAQNPSAQTPSAATSQPNAAATRTQPAASAAQQQPAAASTAQQQPAAASTAQQQQPAAQQPATSAASQPAAPAQQPAQNAQAPAQQNIGAAPGSSAPAAQQTAAANDPQLQVKISEAIGQQNIKPVDVSFSITQGAAVPASVSLRPLPDKVVTIAPQYRGYSYFATKEKIVIVEPSKHTVVAVMPMAGPSRAAAAPASTKQTVKFSKEQQDVIRKRVVTTKKPTTTGSSSTRLSVEQRVPDSVQLEEFSEEVVREVPTVKSYRYYRQDDGLAVIDPGERRVIEIIR